MTVRTTQVRAACSSNSSTAKHVTQQEGHEAHQQPGGTGPLPSLGGTSSGQATPLALDLHMSLSLGQQDYLTARFRRGLAFFSPSQIHAFKPLLKKGF